MIESPFLEKAQLLIEQNRFELAEKEIHQHLATHTDDAIAFALLSMCASGLDDDKRALEYAERAVGLEPDNDAVLYQYARVLVSLDQLKKGEKVIRSAISFNAYDAEYFGLLAIILASRKKFNEALDYANQGLALDPSNLTCLNIRSMAQVKTGDQTGAFSTVEGALEFDPENPITHANYGWGLLEKGDAKKALEHFREALRLDPQNEWAKSGLLEGLKARYFVYRLFLKYAFWMEKMSAGAQFGVIIIVGVMYNRFTSFMFDNEKWQPFLIPIWVLLILTILSSWFLPALMNLYLRLNTYGRYALNEKQKKISTYVGVAVLVAVVGGIGYIATTQNWLGVMGVFGVLMMVPMSNMLEPEKRYKRVISIAITILLLLLGILAIWASALTGLFFTAFAVYFLWVFIGYQVIGNVFKA